MEYRKLKTLAKYPTGKLNSSAAVEDGEYPFFTCAHDIYRIDQYSYDGEYVLLGGNNASGDFPIFYYNGKFDAYQRTYLIQPLSDDTDTKYLFYSIGLKLHQMKANASGIATKFLTQPILNNINIEYRDIDEQKRIADILSAYDNLIENNNKRIRLLEQIAENLYKEWFVRFRFPGYENVEFENGIPKGWEIKSIGKIGNVVGGGTPSTSIEEYWGGDIPWITPADLSNYSHTFIKAGATNITTLGLEKSSAKMLPQNTVLLSSRAPVGYVVIAANPICTNQGFKSVVCDTNIVEPYYLYFVLRSNRSLLEQYATGATFPELSASTFRKIKFLIPEISIQKRFANALRDIFKLSDDLVEQNKCLIKQRDMLLPRLMSGKLEV